MPQVTPFSSRAAFSILAAMLAACSANGSNALTPPALAKTNRTDVALPTASSSSLFVLNSAPDNYSVAVYGTDQGELKSTITKGINQPSSIVLNANGDAVVSNDRGNSITVYDGKRMTLLQKFKVAEPRRLAQDVAGNLYVLTAASVHVFAPGISAPYQTSPIRTISSGIANGKGLAVDSQDNVYVSNYAQPSKGGNTVSVYQNGSDSPTEVISDGVESPYCVAVDASRNVYVGNQGLNGKGSSITVYSPSGFKLLATITNGIDTPLQITFDASDNPYVVGFSEVSKFAAGTLKLRRQLTGFDIAESLAFDREGNAYIADLGRNEVLVYPPKGSTPSQTYSQGIADPIVVAVRP